MNKTLCITAAYGRRYATQAEFHEDWIGGKDFRMPNGLYFSIRDLSMLHTNGYTQVALVQSGMETMVEPLV